MHENWIYRRANEFWCVIGFAWCGSVWSIKCFYHHEVHRRVHFNGANKFSIRMIRCQFDQSNQNGRRKKWSHDRWYFIANIQLQIMEMITQMNSNKFGGYIWYFDRNQCINMHWLIFNWLNIEKPFLFFFGYWLWTMQIKRLHENCTSMDVKPTKIIIVMNTH